MITKGKQEKEIFKLIKKCRLNDNAAYSYASMAAQ